MLRHRAFGFRWLPIFALVGVAPVRAVTLTAGDVLVADAGATATTSGIIQVAPATGNRTFVTGNGVGSGAAIDTPKFPTCSPAGTIYYFETLASGAANCVISVNPATGARTKISGGGTGSGTAFVSVSSMCWDPSTSTLLVSDAGASVSTSGIIRVDPSTGNRTFVTGNGVGSGAALDTPNYVACSNTGTVYYFEMVASGTANKVISVNPATGARTVLSGSGTGTGTNFASVNNLFWDPSTSTILVSDAGTAATTSGVIRVNSSNGNRTFLTGNGAGSGAAIDTPKWVVCSSTGTVSYFETVASGTANCVISVNGSTGARTKISGGGTGTGTAFVSVVSLAVVPLPPPVISSSLTASGTYGSAISTYTIAASNSPTSYNATGLPSGLSVNTTNGQITGTPTQTGTFNITVSATNVSGTGSATLVFTSNKAPLAVTANAASRAYFAANPTFTATITGFVNGDTSAVVSGAASLSTNATSTSAAGGSYTITPTVGTLSATNYSFTTFNTAALTVTKVPLTVTANAASRAYFASNPTFTATYTGFVNSETSAVVTGAPSFSTNATSTSVAGGSYTVTPAAGTLSATNYAFTTFNTGALTITKAPLTVTANAASRTYGAADPTFTATITGFVNSETVAVVTGAPSFSTNATSTSVAGGSYTITPAAGTLSATNYAFTTFNTGALTITKAPLTVTANAASRTYGATDPTFTATITGFVNSETVAVVTGAPSFSTNATSTSVAGGSYTVTPAAGTLSATNYAFTTFNTGVLTIAKAALTVTANAASRAYFASDPSFTATITGFANGEVLATSDVTGGPSFSTNASSTSAAGGAYTITPALGSLSSSNYSFAFATGVLTVTKVPLTVAANPATRAYGAADPAFSAAYTGFVNSETSAVISGAPAFSTDATGTSAPGSGYTITPAAGTLSATNYAFTAFNTATLTITKAPLTVTADAASRVYGAADPAFTATITGFANGEILGTSDVTGSPSFSTNATATSVAGNYVITPALGSLTSSNYSFGFTAGTLTITALAYADWKAEKFTVSEQANPAISGPDADPDGDGTVNLLEYAFDLDPKVSDRTGLPSIATVVDSGSTYAGVTYPRRLGTSDLLYDVEASGDLSTWSTSGVVETGSSDLGTTESVTARDGSALGTGSRRFLRILVTSSSASQPAATDPLGAVALTVQGTGTAPNGRLNLVGLPLTEPVVYQGRLTSVSGSTLVQSGSTWADDAFNGAAGAYFVEIASGAYAGFTLDIVGTSASAHSLSLASVVAGYASAGDVFKVRRHWTIADVFGATNAAGLIAGSLTTADLVQVYVPSTQTYTSYYYKNTGSGGTGWRSDASLSTDMAAAPLYFDEGFLVRKQNAALTWLLVGAVKTGPTVLLVAPGTNYLPNVYPGGALTLGGAQLYTGSATTGLAGGSLTTADLVNLHNPTTGVYTNYYYKTIGMVGGTGWRANTSLSADASGATLPIGGCVLLQRKAAGAFLWHVPQPF